jgi:purine-binding chemotaxis protein CheW
VRKPFARRDQAGRTRNAPGVFALGDEEYGLPITQVQEIIRFSQPRTIPNPHASIRGVINLRGRIIPVCDLKRRLNVGTADVADDACKIVIVESVGGSAGLMVDGVNEVLTVTEDQLEPDTGSEDGSERDREGRRAADRAARRAGADRRARRRAPRQGRLTGRSPGEVGKDLAGRVLARGAGDAAARMGARTAQVEAVRAHSVAREPEHGPPREELIEAGLRVIHVAARDAELALDERRGQHPPLGDHAGQTGRVPLELRDDHVAHLVGVGAVRDPLGEDVHRVVLKGGLEIRPVAQRAVLPAVEGALDVIDPRGDDDPPGQLFWIVDSGELGAG